MIKISAIGEIKRKPAMRAVTGEDGIVYSVSLDIIATRGIECGSQFTQDEWEEILIRSDYELGINYALDCVSRGPKTIKEMRDKLMSRGCRKDASDKVIVRLSELNYLDDSRYAADYVAWNRATKGKFRIRQELYNKGISRKIIDIALLNAGDELECARALAEKHLRGRRCEGKDREQLIRYLAGRGYSFDLIRDAIKAIGGESDDLSDL